MLPQTPSPSPHNLLESDWRRDQEDVPDIDRPRILRYSNGPVSLAVRQDNQSEIREKLLKSCKQYVLNYLPTHLVRIRDMILVTRAEFWEAEKPRVERELQRFDPRTLVESKRGGTPDSTTPRNNWRLPTWGDAVIDMNRDSYVRSLFRFAIFSHRWGEDEPEFSDLMDTRRTKRTTDGYKKLLNFCQKAVDYDCCYAWSDTCCINKERGMEMDEAIRSMYRWYSIATICLVHLAKSSSVKSFASEPWFKRGWTLQELLAPQVIRFYGENWEPICLESEKTGDKANEEIRNAIEEVTGIHHQALCHFVPACNRIAEKMTWASSRETMKTEDAAYCLLGIFNVSLPIMYGEADRAWYRLMRVIAKECTDASFFAWAGQPSPYSRALPSSPGSYLRHDPRHPLSLLGHCLVSYEVTKLGVVIKMPMISTRWNILRDIDGRDIGYMFKAHRLVPFSVGANVERGDVKEYKLGIINFHSIGNTALVEAMEECQCIVLAKRHADDQGWTMVNTECVVVGLCLEKIDQEPETVLLYHTNS